MEYLKDEKKINQIIDEFNKITLNMIKFSKKKEKDNVDLLWLHKVICTIKNENPSIIIEKSIDKLWDNKDQIISRSALFFKNDIEKKWIKDDSRKEWLTTFLSHVKQIMFKLDNTEKEYIWNNVNRLLELSIEYKLLKKYF